MKNWKRLVSVVLTAAVVAVGASFLPDSTITANAAAETKTNTIVVNGNGVIKVAPDIAYVNVGAQISDKDAKVAQNNASKIMNDVVAALKALGIDEKDMQTNGISVYPQYRYDDKTYQETITGYSASNSLKVTVRDITKVGDVIDKATDAGANSNNGVQFSLADKSKYYNDALKQAISSAGEKAKLIASSISVTIGGPSNVTETSYNYDSPIYYGNAKMEMAADSTGRTSVNVGEIEVSASVTVTYGY